MLHLWLYTTKAISEVQPQNRKLKYFFPSKILLYCAFIERFC